jgi:23S rRNA (cytosine1962-C5)-methyltransferase
VSDAYRVAHAEGDDLPGLVVDRLANVLVCEHHALGFWRLRAEVEQALARLYPGLAVLHRIPKSARRAEGMEDEPETEGEAGEVWIREHGLTYPVRPGVGHKTGWFCDQRDNRVTIGALARGRSVLDLCCNAGGFALSCARAGAREVTAVDLDEEALAQAARAAEANALAVRFEHADAFDVLRALPQRAGPRPELLILDPPKLIAGRARMEEGLRKYRDLNALALEAAAPDGLVATFSCSGALELAAFLGLVFGAARRARREVRLLQVLQAAPDHPQRPDWPRSRYLKGALLSVDREP